MRKVHGEYIFTNQDLWSLDCTLSKVIHDGVKQFKESSRLGVPGGLKHSGVWYMSVADDDEKLNTTEEKDGEKTTYISCDAMGKMWEKILDDIILAFKITSDDVDGMSYLITVHDKPELDELYFLTDEDKRIVKEHLNNRNMDYLWDEFREVCKKVDKFIADGRNMFATYLSNMWD